MAGRTELVRPRRQRDRPPPYTARRAIARSLGRSVGSRHVSPLRGGTQGAGLSRSHK